MEQPPQAESAPPKERAAPPASPMSRAIRFLGIVFSWLGLIAFPAGLAWLLILGEWWALGAIVVSLAGRVAIPVALLPGLAIAAAAAKLTVRNRSAGLAV